MMNVALLATASNLTAAWEGGVAYGTERRNSAGRSELADLATLADRCNEPNASDDVLLSAAWAGGAVYALS